MDIRKKANETLAKPARRAEQFIAEKGVGASYLARAKRMQRNLNLAIFMGGILAIAGLTAWAMKNNDGEE